MYDDALINADDLFAALRRSDNGGAWLSNFSDDECVLNGWFDLTKAAALLTNIASRRREFQGRMAERDARACAVDGAY